MMSEAGRGERSGLEPSKGSNLWLLVVRPTAVPKKTSYGIWCRLSYRLIELQSHNGCNGRGCEYAGAFYQVVCQGNQSQGIFGSDADREYYLEGTGGVPAALRLRFMLSADESNQRPLADRNLQGCIARSCRVTVEIYGMLARKQGGTLGFPPLSFCLTVLRCINSSL